MLIAGTRHAQITVICGIIYSLSRLHNAYGYSRTVKGRVPGFVMAVLSMFGVFFAAVHAMYELI